MAFFIWSGWQFPDLTFKIFFKIERNFLSQSHAGSTVKYLKLLSLPTPLPKPTLKTVITFCKRKLWQEGIFSSLLLPTKCMSLKNFTPGSGCGSVGRAVASNTRGPRFESSHQQIYIEHLFTINCIEKTKINKKRPGMAHFKKKDFHPLFQFGSFDVLGAVRPKCGPRWKTITAIKKL